MNLSAKFQNQDRTVGIVRVTDRRDLKRIAGFFNKKILTEMIELFDVFETRDMSIYYEERDYEGKSAGILLLCPNEEKEMFIAVAGKTEALK